MCATPYPVPPQQLPVEDRPAGVETESEDGIYSICGSGVDHSRESEQNYSESEKDTNGSSFGRYTGESGSEISDVVIDNKGRIRGPQYKERTITPRRGTSEEEWEEEDSNIGFAGEGEVTIREEETEGGSQSTEGTDQPERALRSKGAAPAIQLGTREAVVEVTAAAWISKDEGTRGTILRGETEGPEHRRQEDDLDVQLRDGSLKTLTVGQEDDQSTPVPRREVEKNQREPADLTGISGAASDEDSQEVYQEQQITSPFSVRCSSTSLGREIRKRTNYQVVEQTETPSRDPRNLVSEVTPVARQLQFNFTTVEETNINKRKREYGKRKRGSDQAINYEVESIVITDSSTTDIGRNQDPKGISEPKGSEEIVLSEVAEEVHEEEEEGATAWRAQSSDKQTKLIEEENETSNRYTSRGGWFQ